MSSAVVTQGLAVAAEYAEAETRLLAGDLTGARAIAESLVSADPDDFRAVHLLGLLEAREGQIDRAISLLERAVELDQSAWTYWRNLALALFACRRWTSATEILTRACRQHPEDATCLRLLGRAAFECGEFATSSTAYSRAFELEGDPNTALGIAKALNGMHQYSEAAAIAEAVLEEDPNCVEAHDLAVEAHAAAGMPHLALSHCDELLRLRPNSDQMMARFAAIRWDNGDLKGCLELTRTLVEGTRSGPRLHSFHLSGLLHHDGQSATSIRLAHEQWGAQFTRNTPRFVNWPNRCDPERPLRIGYLGGDFYSNPSLHFLLPFFRHHDRRHFEVFGYDLRCRNDSGTTRFRQSSDEWRECQSLEDGEILGRIRTDQIDILVDTTGHYAGGRPWLFAYRPAPLQIAMLNYPATTGLDCFDGITTDRWVCPPGLERQYTEPIIRLESGYLPWEAPESAARVTPLPALTNGFVTFGLFQRPVKISTKCWDAVAAVMRGTPGSRLLIHNVFRHLAEVRSPMRALYEREMEMRGIDRSRLRLVGPLEFQEHLELLGEADIALDTFPYNGQTTTCECLWMGVPVVTLTGTYHVARVGRSILCRAGFREWQADSVRRYISTSLTLAANLPALSRTRMKLRQQIGSSLLVAGQRATCELELGLRSLWRNKCAQLKKGEVST